MIGEARLAITDSYGRMELDDEAQKRIAILDYILTANFHFLAGHDERYEALAACTSMAIADVLPDMAVFALPENTARLRRAHEMFTAMGGTCADPLPEPIQTPAGAEDDALERIIESEDQEKLDLEPR